jgi:hypothetical protein
VSEHAVSLVCDLIAITLVVSMYFHRHQRRDLLLAYVALNVGILSVTTMLTSAAVGAGLGLGLFGILSIIRLRSDSITQEEIAYYFVALALGLLAGVGPGPTYYSPLLIGLLVLVMFVADHPHLMPRARHQILTLDAAIADEKVLRAHIESRLGFDVRHLIVQELDFVRDVTVVDVRYRVPTHSVLPDAESLATIGVTLTTPGGSIPLAGQHAAYPTDSGSIAAQNGGGQIAPGSSGHDPSGSAVPH